MCFRKRACVSHPEQRSRITEAAFANYREGDERCSMPADTHTNLVKHTLVCAVSQCSAEPCAAGGSALIKEEECAELTDSLPFVHSNEDNDAAAPSKSFL